MNSAPTETPPAEVAKMTMLWLGGTSRPSQEEVMVTAVEKSAS